MFSPRVWAGLAPLALSIAVSPALAAEPRGAIPAGSNAPATATAVNLAELVTPKYRDAVNQVLRQPTITAKAEDDEFTAHTKIYEWLIDHPDRAALAWQRLKVPCVSITDLGDGRFSWADEHGSELTWRTVGTLTDGYIWYATGKVKPGPLLPMVPVKAVAVLRTPREKVNEVASEFRPTAQVFLLTDSIAANTVLRMIGPAAPRMAHQGAEQLLLFFSGPARYIYKHPEESQTLLAPKKK